MNTHGLDQSTRQLGQDPQVLDLGISDGEHAATAASELDHAMSITELEERLELEGCTTTRCFARCGP